MNDQARILQQRVQVATFRRAGQQALEGIGGEQDEEQETGGHQPQRSQHTCHHGFRQLARE